MSRSLAARARVAVLFSGRGGNLAALLEACVDPEFPAGVALTLTNNPVAPGIERAREAGARVEVLDHHAYGDARAEFEEAVHEILLGAQIDYVCLAGFMRIFTPAFVKRWDGRMLNIHPSLLPSFKGLNVLERTINAGVKIAGCTVHIVTPEVDAGPIIGQAALAVHPGETPQSLGARIALLEHRLYPACLHRIVSAGEPVTTVDQEALFSPAL